MYQLGYMFCKDCSFILVSETLMFLTFKPFLAIYKDFLVALLTRQIVDAPGDDEHKVYRKYIIFYLSQGLEDFFQVFFQESVETFFLSQSKSFFITLKVPLL